MFFGGFRLLSRSELTMLMLWRHHPKLAYREAALSQQGWLYSGWRGLPWQRDFRRQRARRQILLP